MSGASWRAWDIYDDQGIDSILLGRIVRLYRGEGPDPLWAESVDGRVRSSRGESVLSLAKNLWGADFSLNFNPLDHLRSDDADADADADAEEDES